MYIYITTSKNTLPKSEFDDCESDDSESDDSESDDSESDDSESESDDFDDSESESETRSDDYESESDFNLVFMNLDICIFWFSLYTFLNKLADGFCKQCKYNAYFFLTYHYLKSLFLLL